MTETERSDRNPRSRTLRKKKAIETLDRDETILEEEIEGYLESRKERDTSRLGIGDDESSNRRGQLLSSVATRERVCFFV